MTNIIQHHYEWKLIWQYYGEEEMSQHLQDTFEEIIQRNIVWNTLFIQQECELELGSWQE